MAESRTTWKGRQERVVETPRYPQRRRRGVEDTAPSSDRDRKGPSSRLTRARG